MKTRLSFLSGNVLKIIAAAFMLIDHIGLIFFPRLMFLRAIGRLAFPMFAFMVSEGCKYTSNKLKYVLTMLSVGTVCQIATYLAGEKFQLCILITFTLSALIIFSIDNVRRTTASNAGSDARLLAIIIFLATVGGVILLAYFVPVEYGLIGVLTPVFPYLFGSLCDSSSGRLDKFNTTFG